MVNKDEKAQTYCVICSFDNFSFTLKLITTLLQKLAIFHIWNVKQKGDGIDQNILFCCYDEYVATNKQT